MTFILALETTEKYGSAAVLENREVLAEIQLPKDRRSAQTLAPAIDSLFKQVRRTPSETDAVAVVAGPGSFTGLRVGVTTAKMFAYAVNAALIALKTHETVAAGLPDSVGLVSIGVDAQRGDVVVQNFENRIPCGEPALIPVGSWWSRANGQTLFTGPALERWAAKAPNSVRLAEPAFWFPSAAVAGLLAFDKLDAGAIADIRQLVPVYSRPSAAEEKRNTSCR